MSKLSASLVLNKYILNLFGATDLKTFSEHLKDPVLEGYDENNVSQFYHALVAHLFSSAVLSKEMLLQYDQNIYSHTQTISAKRTDPIRWKYFQYLALLFTEIFLDKYFTGRQALQQELNTFLQLHHGRNKNDFKPIAAYRLEEGVNDLNKLAFWNATGSGKTLLMHINILQYRHYLAAHHQSKTLNRIIVLTPNEGLSRQHLQEFALSGMEAELFDKNGAGLFAGHKIEIIDIHKLEETSGAKTVAVEAFESNNLVLVDEGHRGSGGESWKDKRNRLSTAGFSFEYSATFGQAVHALSGTKQKALIDEYGKATIFDYSYKYFYKDGYGKDYQILNLDEQWHEPGKEDRVQLYLTACLLSFYEQLLVYKFYGKDIAPFLIDKPLAIFVGGKVTKSISKEIASDVVEVLKFIQAFVKEDTETVNRIHLLLEARDGLNNQQGQSIFRTAFKEIRKTGKQAKAVYDDILKEVFNADVSGAMLHIDNLKGQDGEIGLRIGNAENYFGVINVGDDKGLLKICEANKLMVDEKDFSNSLFQKINHKDSRINILIGSKKFTEGWSSWRVSTMGLLNIGRGEGSEIIQLFGRGVRLKGYQFSLKRSTALDISVRPSVVPTVLPVLETLNIFGLRADYMQQFKDYLEEEGLPSEPEFEKIDIPILPTIVNLASKNLKYIRTKDGANFKKENVEAILTAGVPQVFLNWYPKVQVLRSSKSASLSTANTIEEGKLDQQPLAFINWDWLYFNIQKFKNERSWYNLNLSLASLKNILSTDSWYTLKIPSSELEISSFNKVNVWYEIATSLLKSFIERLYNYEKNRFYSDKQELAILDTTHPNFEKEYQLHIKKTEDLLIGKIKQLKELISKSEFKENFRIDTDFEAVFASMHLYQPLLYKNRYEEEVKIQPVALNKGERDFVNDLKTYCQTETAFLENKEIYLLRNISRKGLGFFEANNFYPDFILWIVTEGKQYISFIDPKGLRYVQGLDDPKISLHKTIQITIQPRLNDPSVQLSSFIISNTPYGQLTYWKDQESLEDFNSNNVLFQKEQSKTYIDLLIRKIIAI